MPSTDILKGQDFSTGTIDCPDCGGRIALDFRLLLQGDSFPCNGCGAVVSLDLEESRATLDALKEAQKALSAATNGKIKPLD